MSDPSVPTDTSTDTPLQFDSAHAGEAPTTLCTSCSEPIRGVYHEANGNVVCSRCRGKLEVLIASTGGMRRFRRAAGFGLGAAIGCAVAYGAFRAYSDWDFSLIAIFVGFAVGKAVFVGGERRGGRRYQVLAALLTYFAIASSYVPLAVKELKDSRSTVADSTKAAVKGDSTTSLATTPTADSNTASVDSRAAVDLPAATKKAADKPMGFGGFLVGVGALMLLVLALPIMVGMGSIISVVILALGLVQAWRMNKAVTINVSGPYRLADPATDAQPATA